MQYYRIRIVTYDKDENTTSVYMEDFSFGDNETEKEINSWLVKKITELREDYNIISYTFKQIRKDEYEFYYLTTY